LPQSYDIYDYFIAMSLSDTRSFIDYLAEGSVCTTSQSSMGLTQPCESHLSVWILSVTSTSHVSLKASKLGEEQPGPSDLAVLKPLYLPGGRAFPKGPKGSLLRYNRASKGGREDKGEICDKLPDDTYESAISLVTGEGTSPSSAFDPAPCGDAIVVNKGDEIKELIFDLKGTRLARFMSEQARLEIALAREFEQVCKENGSPGTIAELAEEMMAHQKKHHSQKTNSELASRLALCFCKIHSTALLEAYEKLGIRENHEAEGWIVKIVLMVFLVYSPNLLEVSKDEGISDLYKALDLLRKDNRVYMPGHEQKLNPWL
jgi:hypothetical protein